MEQRDLRIDLLRFIGLLMVVLAHVEPNPLVFQVRNFDVPLLVLVSGMSFAISYKNTPLLSYIWKRFQRLVLPVWIFLTLYFIGSAFFDRFFDGKTILTSYALLSGIGFVWVIRVFFVVSICAPFLLLSGDFFARRGLFSLGWILAWCLCEILLNNCCAIPSAALSRVVENFVVYVIPYGLIFIIGIRILRTSSREVSYWLLFFLAVFFSFGVYFYAGRGSFVQTQDFKYPAQAYYVSYALAVSLFLWLTSDFYLKRIERVPLLHKFFLFVSGNTIWIYLWHIAFLDVFEYIWFVRYFLVLLASTLVTYVQVKMVRRFSERYPNSPWSSKLKILLTG